MVQEREKWCEGIIQRNRVILFTIEREMIMKPKVKGLRYRWICLLLAMGLCMNGCGAAGSEDNVNTGTENRESAGGITMPAVYSSEKNEDSIMPTASPDAEPPKNGIYATCGNYDIEISPLSNMAGIGFYVLSQEELPEDMEVVIDTIAPYEFHIEKIDLMTDPVYQMGEQSFPLFLYQCYRGVDWVKLGQMDIVVEEARKKYENEEDEEEKKLLEEEYLRLATEFSVMSGVYWEDYMTFLEEVNADTLGFCCYWVYISFSTFDSDFDEENPKPEEAQKITSLKLQSGDWSTVIEIGNVEIEYDYPEEKEVFCHYENFVLDSGTGGVAVGYQTGQGYCNNAIECIAMRNITVKNIYFYNDPDAVIEKVRIDIGTDGGMQSVLWEPGREILIREGEQFKVDILFTDPKMADMGYYGNKVLFAECETEGERYIITGKTLMNWERELRTVYAQYFQGIDVESYYKYFYFPQLERGLPENWDENLGVIG